MLNFSDIIEPHKILRLLSRSVPYYLKSWSDIDEQYGLFGSIDPKGFNMRTVGSSSPVIEYVIRPHINTLCILSSYLYLNKCDLTDAIISSDALIEKLNKGIRWACETHLTGTLDVETFLGRKRWGENWRSSLWASLLAVCAVFGRNSIEPILLRRIEEVIAFEANRFIGVIPPSGCEIDTKVEENAQDAMVLAWAINLIPEHPNAREWEGALRIWAVNTASSIHDRADHSEYFGKSLSRSVTSQNHFPDMTAENHGFFHPEILAYGTWVILGIAAFAINNKKIPDYLLRKNHQRTYELLLRFCLPTGMIYAPGSHDFPLFIPRPMAFAWGLWNHDHRAQSLTARLLSWMDTCLLATQEKEGPWVFGFSQTHDGWELLFQSSIGVELALLACLPFGSTHKVCSTTQSENTFDTRHIYPYVEVCYRRNIRTTRSMAWKALGGHPIVGFNVHSQPELLFPVKAGGLGIPQVSDHIQSFEVQFHHDRIQRDGFDTYGRINYFGTSGIQVLHRDIRVLTWGDEGIIVLDEITADTPIAVLEHFLSPIHLVNDHWTGDSLEFYSGSLRETFSGAVRKTREVQCPSFWASIGTHFVFQFIWGRTKGLYYLPGSERNAPQYWKNCRLDKLAVHVEPQEVNKGGIFYRVGFYIGTGKGPRPFKSAGIAGDFFKGLVIMDGKMTAGLD